MFAVRFIGSEVMMLVTTCFVGATRDLQASLQLLGASKFRRGTRTFPLSSPGGLPRVVDTFAVSASASVAGRFAGRPGRHIAVALAAVASARQKRRQRCVKPGQVSPLRHVPEHILRPPYLAPGGPRSPSDGFPDHEYMFNRDLHRIEVKGPDQIEAMRAAGALAREALEVAGRMVEPGVTTDAIDAAVHDFIISRGAYPSPLGYMGFPKAICTSVNDVIAHGIPDSRSLEDGDIVNVDVTVYLNGYHGDTSSMFLAGRPSQQAAALCEAARQAMNAGIRACGPGKDFRDVGRAIAEVTRDSGFYCSALLSGHGIGSYFHGAPEVIPAINNVDQGVMKPGMTFTIEPVLVENNDATWALSDDGWTLQTKTGAWTAQFEHTVLVTETGFEVLTGPSVNYRAMAREALPKGAGGGRGFAPRPPAGGGQRRGR